MTPLSLIVQGLYSYQGKQEIDFMRLTQAQIFGIFGATGSGKSSILEAITYALYGQSERLNQRDNRSYNMMNLKSDRLLIDFECEMGGERYKFVVQGKRNRKQFENVGTLERKAFRYEQGQPVPLESVSAEALLGLSYDNFKRTIIIPQGKFQEFLQLTETDRTRMLKEIFQLEKYELYQKTNALDRKNNSQLAQAETLLDQLAHATPAAAEELQQQVSSTQAQLRQYQTQQQALTDSLRQMEQLQGLFSEIEQQQRLLAKLEAEAPEQESRKSQVARYEACLIDFKPQLDRKQELIQQLEQFNQTLTAKKASQTESEQELQRALEAFKRIESTYANRQDFLKRAEEWEWLIKLKAMAQNVAALTERIEKGQDLIGKLQRDIEQMKVERMAKTQTRRDAEKRRPDVRAIMAVKEWFDQHERQQQILSKAQADWLESQQKQEELEREKVQLLKASPLSHTQYILSIAQLQVLLQQQQSDAETKLAEVEKNWEQVQVQAQLQVYLDQLKAGAPCPLCGATDHPKVLKLAHAQQAQQSLPKQIQAHKDRIFHLQELLLKIGLLGQQQETAQREQQSRHQVVLEAEQALELQQTRFPGATYSPEEAEKVQTDLQQIQTLDQKIAQIDREIEALETTIAKEEKNLNLYQQRWETLRQQREQEKLNMQSQLGSLRFLTFEAEQHRENAELEAAALAEKAQYENVEKLYQQGQERTQRFRTQVDQLKGEISELEKLAKQNRTRLARLNRELEAQVDASAFASLQEVSDTLAQQLDLAAAKRAIEHYQQQVLQTRHKLEALQAQTQGKAFDLKRYEQSQAESQALTVQLNETQRQLGGLQKEWERLEKELTQKNELQNQREHLKLRQEDLKTLKNLFARSGFVNYVSSIYLRNLCLAANERFHTLTRGSLSLEPTENNSFQVRDYLHNGQIRSVKTLSGGQTFQASLSLALALADQVGQQAREAQHFFFLDEGFGSQDKQSLQLIFQTLSSLRQEQRIVGVISHVEELQQEIDTYLYIDNHPEKGSQVKGSWEA